MSISRIVTSIIHTNIIVDTTTNIVDTSIYINIFFHLASGWTMRSDMTVR